MSTMYFRLNSLSCFIILLRFVVVYCGHGTGQSADVGHQGNAKKGPSTSNQNTIGGDDGNGEEYAGLISPDSLAELPMKIGPEQAEKYALIIVDTMQGWIDGLERANGKYDISNEELAVKLLEDPYAAFFNPMSGHLNKENVGQKNMEIQIYKFCEAIFKRKKATRIATVEDIRTVEEVDDFYRAKCFCQVGTFFAVAHVFLHQLSNDEGNIEALVAKPSSSSKNHQNAHMLTVNEARGIGSGVRRQHSGGPSMNNSAKQTELMTMAKKEKINIKDTVMASRIHYKKQELDQKLGNLQRALFPIWEAAKSLLLHGHEQNGDHRGMLSTNHVAAIKKALENLTQAKMVGLISHLCKVENN